MRAIARGYKNKDGAADPAVARVSAQTSVAPYNIGDESPRPQQCHSLNCAWCAVSATVMDSCTAAPKPVYQNPACTEDHAPVSRQRKG
ncbi:hypothetical protein NDU88_010811 [Pleurodeles waltl]|uniref:Uncharacterized protein n=1 Tax=Pleurodeles waltl TaxID=8319 RepID=A0AAV7R1A5_PLEWA|nr:hypothetical protein NDU88_010811 [Pleurodeles waltl]